MQITFQKFESSNSDLHDKNLRSGFTLVELLVSVSIFVILMSLTVGVIWSAADGDRISASARSLQATLEGVRVRAYKMKDLGKDTGENITAVGIRFMVDEDDWSTVDSMIYLVQRKNKGRIRVLSRSEHTPAIGPTDQHNQVKYITTTGEVLGVQFKDLLSRYLIRGGLPINIHGADRTISEDNFVSLVNQNILEVFPPFEASQTGKSDYEITLLPTIMPQAEPIQFAKGTVIDLNSSALPNSWAYLVNRIKNRNLPSSNASSSKWKPNFGYAAGSFVFPNGLNGQFYKAVVSGTSGSSEPTQMGSSPPSIGTTFTDGSVSWQSFDKPYFDLMFTSQGTVAGSTATTGVIHFVVALKRDTDLGLNVRHKYYNDERSGPMTTSSTPVPDPLIQRGETSLVTIFTQSGMITSSDVNPLDSDSDYLADDPFKFAITGSERTQ